MIFELFYGYLSFFYCNVKSSMIMLGSMIVVFIRFSCKIFFIFFCVGKLELGFLIWRKKIMIVIVMFLIGRLM